MIRVPGTDTARRPKESVGETERSGSTPCISSPVSTRTKWWRRPNGSPSWMSTKNRSTAPPSTNQTFAGSSIKKGLLPSSSEPCAKRRKISSTATRERWATTVLCCTHELCLDPFLLHQLMMRPALGDQAALEDDDLVGVADGAQPMGDDQAGAAAPPEVLID